MGLNSFFSTSLSWYQEHPFKYSRRLLSCYFFFFSLLPNIANNLGSSSFFSFCSVPTSNYSKSPPCHLYHALSRKSAQPRSNPADQPTIGISNRSWNDLCFSHSSHWNPDNPKTCVTHHRNSYHRARDSPPVRLHHRHSTIKTLDLIENLSPPLRQQPATIPNSFHKTANPNPI